MKTDEILGTAPITLLRECPFNPRKSYPEAELQELAASIRELGLLQPIVVRPVPLTAEVGAGQKWAGLEYFEIVAGHRRFRALQSVGETDVPVVVRWLDDTDALAAMCVENGARADVPPSEEAVAYRDLVAKLGVAGAAERLGKPAAVVRDRAALAALPKWFLAAVDAKLVPASVAALVARVPGAESREKAAVCVAVGETRPDQLGDDWREEWFDATGEEGEEAPTLRNDYADVLTFRDAKDLIRTHFCRELKGAPFSRTSLTLVPDAGSCDACPKRAGNDEDLKAEGVRGDTCTDPDCYATKVEAYRSAELLKAKSKHNAEPADGLNWPAWQDAPTGWCRLDQAVAGSELDHPPGGWTGKKGEQTVGELLKKCGTAAVPTAVTFHPKTGKAVLVVRTKDARKHLEFAGLMRKPVKEKRVPLGDEEVSTRPRKTEPAPDVRYRVTVDWAKLGVVEFEAPADLTETDRYRDAEEVLLDALGPLLKCEPVPYKAGDEETPYLPPPAVRSCRACGCTDDDCRRCIEKTGSPCSWVEGDLCSACVPPANKTAKKKPGTVGTLTAPSPSAPTPGPVVCAPVGAGQLKDIPGITATDAACLSAVGLRTLADVERACDQVRAAHSNKDHYAPGVGSQLYQALRKFPGAFTPGDVTRIGDAIINHLTAAVRAPAPTPTPPRKPKKKEAA